MQENICLQSVFSTTANINIYFQHDVALKAVFPKLGLALSYIDFLGNKFQSLFQMLFDSIFKWSYLFPNYNHYCYLAMLTALGVIFSATDSVCTLQVSL